MSLEPVHVVPYDPRWPALFEIERARIEAVVGEFVEAIEHIGSTAVPGLDAKPVVDLMVGVRSLRDADRCIGPLEGIGYSYWSEDPRAYRRFFVRFANPEDRAHPQPPHRGDHARVLGAPSTLSRPPENPPRDRPGVRPAET